MVNAFGNNPAARYHGFHAKWNFNRAEDKTYTVTAKICGSDTPLRTEQITFHYETDPLYNVSPGITLPEVTVTAPSLYDNSGGGTVWFQPYNSGAGYGPGGSNGGNGGSGGSGSNSSYSEFMRNYRLVGPGKPINLAQKLGCFGTVPFDPKYKYSVTMYVDQPINGSRSIAKTNINEGRIPGHTYLGFERFDSSTGETVRLVAGFYVQAEWKAGVNLSSESAWGDDGGTYYDVSVKVDMTASDFKDVIYRAKYFGNPKYNITSNNCTSFAYNAISSYVSPPNGKSLIGPYGSGLTPAALGQDLRESAGSYGNKITVADNSVSPTSTNCN